jgi:hypothetical protein
MYFTLSLPLLVNMILRSGAFTLPARHSMANRFFKASIATESDMTTPIVNSNAYEECSMDDIVSLCKRRGFIFPSSEIYNGYAGFYDYGPLGAELKKNIKDSWWKHFVQKREDVVGLDSSIIHNPTTWKSSGKYTLMLGEILFLSRAT